MNACVVGGDHSKLIPGGKWEGRAGGVGRPVSLQVDAYPGRTFTARVRYVSPALSASTRALIVEAVLANSAGELKPGFFATARIEQAAPTPALLVPTRAVQSISGTQRVFIAKGDRAEERIVTTGQTVDDLVEIVSGLAKGEPVILEHPDAKSTLSRPSVRRCWCAVDGAPHLRVHAAALALYLAAGATEAFDWAQRPLFLPFGEQPREERLAVLAGLVVRMERGSPPG